MPEIVATDDLARRLSELSPTHVAVAFIGRDWRRYLDSGRLEQVVVSPGLGTNPAAVVDLAEKIGWDRVLLLDELHSKLYWSADSVLIGSANLSRAALEPGGQQEVFRLACRQRLRRPRTRDISWLCASGRSGISY